MEVLLVLLGAVLALGGQFAHEWWRARRRTNVILLALWEELKAVHFDPPAKDFGGFSSQTFDELFTDIATVLPPDVARQIIRYHLRMKHLAGLPARHVMLSVADIQQAEGMRDALVATLEAETPRKLLPKR